jgi:transposase-like protein
VSQINHYSAAEKLLIIKELEADLTRKDVAHKYGIIITTLVVVMIS